MKSKTDEKGYKQTIQDNFQNMRWHDIPYYLD